MVTVGLLVRVEAKPGKEDAVAEFLTSLQATVERESRTTAWFAIRFGPTSFGVFDAFPDDESRRAHMASEVAAALIAGMDELLASSPSYEEVDLLGSKLPG